MHDISPYNLDRTISISGELKEIADAEQLITEKLRQYEVCNFYKFSLILALKWFLQSFVFQSDIQSMSQQSLYPGLNPNQIQMFPGLNHNMPPGYPPYGGMSHTKAYAHEYKNLKTILEYKRFSCAYA